jgi:homogentisate 1,2-dioxygenase
MSGHGPEADVFLKASNADLKPFKVGEGSMAFMFETTYMMKLSDYAMDPKNQDTEYYKCWENIPKVFNKDKKEW